MVAKNSARITSTWKSRLLMATLFCLFAGVVAMYFVQSLLDPPHPESAEKVKLKIPRGADTNQIATLLEKKGLIKNKHAFIYYSRFTGADSTLKSGRYSLSPGSSVPELVDSLVNGTTNLVKFTVPEGFTAEQIGNLLEDKELIEKDRFTEVLSGGEFNFSFLKSSNSSRGELPLEGYLFPDTYYVGKNITPEKIIKLMLLRFDREMQALRFPERIERMGFTLDEGVTIASMVEKEARIDSERPVIAGVILNRLEIGMPLQIDATVQYALDGHRSKLLYEDLQVDSPYNTYKIKGLPPGPIGSPGRKSLQAVIEPAQTDYLYYVAKPDGSHAFAKTLQDHNANVAKYQ